MQWRAFVGLGTQIRSGDLILCERPRDPVVERGGGVGSVRAPLCRRLTLAEATVPQVRI
jgi:hypothetical protein